MLARHILCLQRLGAGDGLHKAELLEAWLYAALTDLSAQIAAVPTGAHLSPEDDRALSHLKSIYISLMLVALLVSQLKRELLATADLLAMRAGHGIILTCALPAQFTALSGYIDTS